MPNDEIRELSDTLCIDGTTYNINAKYSNEANHAEIANKATSAENSKVSNSSNQVRQLFWDSRSLTDFEKNPVTITTENNRGVFFVTGSEDDRESFSEYLQNVCKALNSEEAVSSYAGSFVYFANVTDGTKKYQNTYLYQPVYDEGSVSFEVSSIMTKVSMASYAEEAGIAETAKWAEKAATAEKATTTIESDRAKNADYLAKTYSDPGHGVYTIKYDCTNISELYNKTSKLFEELGQVVYLFKALLESLVGEDNSGYIPDALKLSSLDIFEEMLRDDAYNNAGEFESLRVVYQALKNLNK